jgi:hypothetical protein
LIASRSAMPSSSRWASRSRSDMFNGPQIECQFQSLNLSWFVAP